MSSLKDFVKNKQTADLLSTGEDFVKNKQTTNLPSTGEVKSAITASFSVNPELLTLSTSKKEQFTNKVTELVKSDEVLTELSEALGKPKKLESEEEFVKRGKLILARILKNKLAK